MLAMVVVVVAQGALPPPFPKDPLQELERTCFQTGGPWSDAGNLRSDVAIVYGIDPGLPARIATWRDRGYRIHVMTGVSWGNYQDYLYGRFDGIRHEDEAQTDRNGNKISHGGDVYYMCPGENFGKFLCVGVQRALDAGAEAIHLEEPEFWVRAGYSEGFRREWRQYYGEDWLPPHSSVDAQWRASKLKYYLYRRALQQVFDHVQEFNRKTGRQVRCYVPTHSLLNYAHWRIVSPESSLARLKGCDGYIAQVWTGTSRTPNQYRGVVRERTFETAFLEYGAMQNLVRSTGRTVWYLNDPIEDDPKHDWDDYRANWESTLVASLLQPEVWQYEVAPWPERVFAGKYPANSPNPAPIPPGYATELQVVMNALNDLRQPRWRWESGTTGIGLVISDTLMFQRGEPDGGDRHLGQVYGLALPLLKRGIPVMPVQLENVTIPGYLRGLRVLFLTYRGMKPMAPDVHGALARWVRSGGSLVVVDDDGDPYRLVREWWNSEGRDYPTPRRHLFEACGVEDQAFASVESGPAPTGVRVGRGTVFWQRSNPSDLAAAADGDRVVADLARRAVEVGGRRWQETHYLLLRRGPYLVAAGLDETTSAATRTIDGRMVDLFDPALPVLRQTSLPGGARRFLLDLDKVGNGGPQVLASACKALPMKSGDRHVMEWMVEGVRGTRAVVLLRMPKLAKRVMLDGVEVSDTTYSVQDRLLWVRFENESRPRILSISLN